MVVDFERAKFLDCQEPNGGQPKRRKKNKAQLREQVEELDEVKAAVSNCLKAMSVQ